MDESDQWTTKRLLKKGNSNMDCPLCKGKMEMGKTILPFEMKNSRVIVVQNVPAKICEQCGKEYVDMDVARNVEALLNRLELDGLSMGFVEYGVAA
jgi:YgiT-type zinc finger domain-containing protein